MIDRIAAAVARIFYRLDVIGEVPGRGAVLLLPNHPNALLDPALVMATSGRAVRFLAKSTLFGGPLRPLLAATGAIPVFRKQDGGETARNEQTFAAVDAALGRGEAVCVFPEGISHSSGRLEPLRTGAARMALSAKRAGIEVRLVPVGINLERKTSFRSRATIAYGQPFTVEPPAGNAADGARAVTVLIADHMRALLVEADPRADAMLVERIDRLYRSERRGDPDPVASLARRKAIADAIRRLRAERPESYQAALVQFRRYDDRLRRFGLHDSALDWDVSTAAARTFVAREGPMAVVLVPVAAAALAGFCIPYALTAAAARVTGDMDVTATAKVIGGGVIYTLWIVLVAAVAWSFRGWPAALLAFACLPGLAIGGLFAIEREASAWQTARSWLALRDAQPTTRAALRRRRAELADVLEQVNEWVQRETGIAADQR